MFLQAIFMNRFFILFVLPLFVLAACKSNRSVSDIQPDQVINFDTLVISAAPSRPNYKAAEPQLVDLIHTKLEVGFDWENQYLIGKAEVTLRPYFYATNKVLLDAHNFDFRKVALKLDSSMLELKYQYDGSQMVLELDREYTRNDTLTLFFDYTAKPNEKPVGGGSAIAQDKGLFFINPTGEQAHKPRQIWTQGEPESNSGWFPTVDAPNQRMSQELFITVDEKYTTLSNGAMVFQSINGDGTRTDYWKQDQPHAPYLTMMAVGEFIVVEDSWDEIDVNYLLESSYAPYAKAIFGNTPEMLEFYSKRLGVPYPWDKYHQVVVRDYVSGAMENTSAVIHGEFLHQTERELLDSDNEDVIAHELFHHWFGDLVTCESWANLPLNESFATYGEYLWIEYKYGREAADEHLNDDLGDYLSESRGKKVNMIRFDHDTPDDMFDSHSYAKGGRILHMLRKELGDEAFFETLRVYLETNRYRAVEIHDLRLAAEKVTGKDLNWFFDQWFLSSGHPELEIAYQWDADKGVQSITVTQKQNFDNTPIYRLPITIDLYVGGKRQRYDRVIDEVEHTFEFPCSTQPFWVNFDGEKSLLGSKTDLKSAPDWIRQYYHGPLYLDRREAIVACAKLSKQDTTAAELILAAIDDDYHGLRLLALNSLENVVPIFRSEVRAKLERLAQKDAKAPIRATAIQRLSEYYDHDETLEKHYRNALNDQSYLVMSNAFIALAEANPKSGMKLAKSLESETGKSLLLTIAGYYGKNGSEEQAAFFQNTAPSITGFDKLDFASSYINFLMQDGISESTLQAGLNEFENLGRYGGLWFMRYYGIDHIRKVRDLYQDRNNSLRKDLARVEAEGSDLLLINEIQKEINLNQEKVEAINDRLKKLKDLETDPRVLRLMD